MSTDDITYLRDVYSVSKDQPVYRLTQDEVEDRITRVASAFDGYPDTFRIEVAEDTYHGLHVNGRVDEDDVCVFYTDMTWDDAADHLPDADADRFEGEYYRFDDRTFLVFDRTHEESVPIVYDEDLPDQADIRMPTTDAYEQELSRAVDELLSNPRWNVDA